MKDRFSLLPLSAVKGIAPAHVPPQFCNPIQSPQLPELPGRAPLTETPILQSSLIFLLDGIHIHIDADSCCPFRFDRIILFKNLVQQVSDGICTITTVELYVGFPLVLTTESFDYGGRGPHDDILGCNFSDDVTKFVGY